MNHQSTALIGIEAGLLKGIDTIRWTIESLQKISEVSAVSTVVQCNRAGDRPSLMVVVKVIVHGTSENIIEKLVQIEGEYDSKLKRIEPLRCLLLTLDQNVVLTPNVTLPHPQMVDIPAWLFCCWEVWRAYRHPILDLTLERLLAQTNVSEVEFFSQGKVVISNTPLF